MSVTKCEECGFEITFKADNCPNCGEGLNGDIGTFWIFVQRLILIILAICFFISAIKFIR